MIDEKVLNSNPERYFIMIRYLHSYARGITGANRTNIIVVGSSKNGFDTRQDALAHYKQLKSQGKFKNVTIEPAKDGYGAIGTFYTSPKIIKGKNFAAYTQTNIYKNTGYQILEQNEPSGGSKIKMRAPKKAGKPQRNVTVAQDKRSDYTKKGYTYIGLAKQDFDTTKEPEATKKTRKTKKMSKNSTLQTVKTEGMSLMNIYNNMQEQKKPKAEKLSPEEIEAAGNYFGASNMGLIDHNQQEKVFSLIKNGEWKKVTHFVWNLFQSLAESDEMLDGMEKEVKMWLKDMKRDKKTQAMWLERKAKAGWKADSQNHW